MPEEATPIEFGDSTGGLIPYKNPSALISYYCGVFSIIPVANFILGPAAIILGIKGIRYRNAHPTAKGLAHAWVGIIGGSLTLLFYGGFVLLGIIAAASHK